MRKKIRDEKNVGSPDVETRTVGIELIIFHIFIGAFYTIPFGGFLTYNHRDCRASTWWLIMEMWWLIMEMWWLIGSAPDY